VIKWVDWAKLAGKSVKIGREKNLGIANELKNQFFCACRSLASYAQARDLQALIHLTEIPSLRAKSKALSR
jgi:hypothetical protein